MIVRNIALIAVGGVVASVFFLLRYEPDLGILKKPHAPPDFCVESFEAEPTLLEDGRTLELQGRMVKGNAACVYLNMTAHLDEIPVDVTFANEIGTRPAGPHAFSGWRFTPKIETEGKLRIVVQHHITHPHYQEEIRETTLAVIGYPPG